MSRYFVPITIDELREKIDKALEEKGGNSYRAYRNITPNVEKDLDKVHFDCENFTCEGNGFGYGKEITGYHTLDNGFTFLGCSAGGDWEPATYFILYYSGKELRGYIPKDGNAWNYKAKWALGNCNWEDFEAGYGGEHDYPDQKFAMDMGLFDDEEDWSQSSKKEREQFYREREPDDIAHKLMNTNKIIEDIKARILKK